MKRKLLIIAILLTTVANCLFAQQAQRRPIDNEHPMWFIHVDVWFAADPQKIIDLIPDDIKPYVCLNLSLSCQYDTKTNVYKMPQQAVRTYKSWATVCQQNGMWFTCQPASGGHTHIQDDDIETFEYFFKRYPNFLGWNYAEQFWGFDEAGDLSSSTQATRLALFAKLVEMSHQYGGLLTVSFCGNIWSHPLNPVGMMKREPKLLEACRKHPESILWLYKYTTSSCFYNNESVSFSPFISGLATNYGVRYDNCGWNGALEGILGKNNGKTYPASAGVGTVLEQTGINGGAVWDGPELTWREECFHEASQTTVDGYKRRNWAQFPNFKGVWADMFRKIIDGTVYIPSRKEVIDRMKIVVINDVNAGTDEDKYAAWGDLYDGLYKQDDPFNKGNGQWMDNYCYFKKTGRYATIPVCLELTDDLAKSIPVQVKKTEYKTRWSNQAAKVAEFNAQYPEVSTGDLFVARTANQLVAYTPYSYLNKKTTAQGTIPLQYNTCDEMTLNFNKLSGGLVREYGNHIDFYLNNFRTDTTTALDDIITIKGATSKPSYTLTKRNNTACTATENWTDGVYTLTLKHCGPIDVTINCSGSNTRPEAPAAKALSLPKQPEPYHGEIIIEAEDMDFKDIKSCCTNPFYAYPYEIGHSGNGFVDFGTSKSGSLRHQITLRDGGLHRICVRYMNSSKDGDLVVNVNGTDYSIYAPKTPSNTWIKTTFNVQLNAGVNVLKINNTEGLALYVDQVIYTPCDVEDEKFSVTIRKAEQGGTIIADKSEAVEGEPVKLTVKADEGWQLTELRVVNSVYFTLGTKIPFTEGATEVTFNMPDDNWSILPVFKEVAAVSKVDFKDVTSGSLPQGWRCEQESGEIHEYPNTYDRGARSFSGFNGYQGKALYWREQYAEYGAQSAYPLELKAGEYKLTYAMAAWKGSPEYKVEILDASGNAIASSETFTAAPNAEGNTSADVSSATLRELSFKVDKTAKFRIRFSNQSAAGGGLREFLLLACKVNVIQYFDEPDVPTPTSEIIDLLGGIKVWSYEHTIFIEAQPDTEYQIIDVTGRPIKKGVTRSDREEVSVSRSTGIAIVRIGNRSFKVMY